MAVNTAAPRPTKNIFLLLVMSACPRRLESERSTSPRTRASVEHTNPSAVHLHGRVALTIVGSPL